MHTLRTLPPRPRLIVGLAMLAVLAIVTAAAAWRLLRPPDETWARLQEGGPLRVAIDPSFPPFDALDDNGNLTGFDVDLGRELGQRLATPMEFRAIAFDGLVDAVIAGKVDVVISAFPLDPRLTRDVRFSRPYFEAGLVLVSPTGSDVRVAEDLVGRTVAVEWGSLSDAWARERGYVFPAKRRPTRRWLPSGLAMPTPPLSMPSQSPWRRRPAS